MASSPQDRPAQSAASAGSTSDPRGATHADDPTRGTGTSSPAPAPEVQGGVPLGASIEGYLLNEELHRGGQGIVYRATQLGTKRQVALKVLLEGPFAGENARRRFEREVELAASLRHPNIVTILDSGLSRGRYYFAMEYIDGLRLDRYVAQKRPSIAEALLLCEKVCDAVNFAHQRGVIHRDLKPPNILVDADGEPHILDFGLAKPVHRLAATESTVQDLSTSGQLVGTVAYMSPEQAAGSQDVDVRTDVYSLGVIFYEALTGRHPYVVDGPLGEILSRIAHDEPENPRSVAGPLRDRDKIDDELATILLKALEKEPGRRYQTAGDLGFDLRHRRLGEPIEAKRASGLYMMKKMLRRYRLHAATAGLSLLLLVGFLVTFAVLFSDERAARQEAVEKSEEARQAAIQQQAALREARERTTEAMQAQQDLRRALVREQIQRGDLALARGDVREARDSYWQALEVGPSPAATWALRRYYLQTFESDTALLALEPYAGRKLNTRARLSPNGAWAAVCNVPDSIALRRLAREFSSSWARAPGPVALASVTDDGALAAAGDDWARAWPPGAACPAVAAQLNERYRPSAVYPVAGGTALLVLEERAVRLFTGPAGQQVRRVVLKGTHTGVPAFAPRLGQLAVPTTAGVELISILPADGLRDDLIWTGSTPARAVRFDDSGRLAVLADAVYVAAAGGAGQSRWTRGIDAPAEWELFDVQDDGAAIALGARDGRLAVYRGGELKAVWRCTVDRLEQLSLSASDQSVVTLDDRSLVTRWVAPEHIEQRRPVLDAPPLTWAASGDGSVVLLGVTRGQVLAYSYAPGAASPGVGWPQIRTILRPRLLDWGGEGTALALDADGGRAVIRDRSTVRFVRLSDRAARAVPWRQAVFSVLDKIAISGDGSLVALLLGNQPGDRQRVLFRRWNVPDEAATTSEPAGDTRAAPVVDFVGALVRDVAFIPRTRRLLVVRSNAQLLVVDPEAPTISAEPWLKLDAPPAAVAFSRTGAYLAAACDDNVLRLISVARHEVRQRIPISGRVSALAFNPRDDILLVRTADGTIRLIDPATGESIAAWPLPAGTSDPLAVWVGDDADAMLLGQGQGVYEYRYAGADAIIERNRSYACEQRVARSLANADFPAAWDTALRLTELDAQRGRCAQRAVLEAALRRPNVDVPARWAQETLLNAGSMDYARLGHAAYDGERFDLAREWLGRSAALAGAAVDATTRWRLAACEYLGGNYDGAESGLAAALQQPDFDPGQAPTAALQRVAALWLAGRTSAARSAALQVGAPDAQGRRGDPVAATYASAIARVMTGIEREDRLATVVDSLLGNVGERPLLFKEDVHFFAGELARQRGDRNGAAIRYQRCIDLARDEWPANWAHYRLNQLASAAAGQ
jgi:tetratricopeptide (TPR) repeat protein/predicted Ser/Thr protein kinase